MSLYILTGDKGIGKTTIIQNWSKGRHDTGGFLTPLYDAKRIFFFLAEKKYVSMETDHDTQTEAWKIGKYTFSKDSFNKAIKVLNDDWMDGKQLCILDEFGPLELEGKGLLPGLNNVIYSSINSGDQDLLVVVRSNLLEDFTSRYQASKIFSIHTINELFSRYPDLQEY